MALFNLGNVKFGLGDPYFITGWDILQNLEETQKNWGKVFSMGWVSAFFFKTGEISPKKEIQNLKKKVILKVFNHIKSEGEKVKIAIFLYLVFSV